MGTGVGFAVGLIVETLGESLGAFVGESVLAVGDNDGVAEGSPSPQSAMTSARISGRLCHVLGLILT